MTVVPPEEAESGGGLPSRVREYVRQNPTKAAVIGVGGLAALTLVRGEEPARQRVSRLVPTRTATRGGGRRA